MQKETRTQNTKTRTKKSRRELEKEIKVLKERFQQLAKRLLEDQERERNAIGRELHDEVGGYLTILGIYLNKIAKEPENKAWLQQFTQALEEMVQYVRSLSHSLYPVMLERGDLTAALTAYFDSYQKKTGIHTLFTCKGLENRLPSHLEAVVYRIIQEALTNVAKHAAAQQVKVEIIRTKNSVRFNVEDNGRGFDANKVLPKDAYGISGMKNRALFAGGTLEIKSTPGQGTSVNCVIPIVEPYKAKKTFAEIKK